MRVELIRRGHFGHLYLSGRFDSLEIGDPAWQRWSDAVLEASRASRGVLTFVDLRDVSYADSRAIHRLLDVVEPLRRVGEIIFLGPGTGFARLAALGEAPRLVPMLDTAPWESGDATEVQLEGFERREGLSAEIVAEEAWARSESAPPAPSSLDPSSLEPLSPEDSPREDLEPEGADAESVGTKPSDRVAPPSAVEIPDEVGAHEWERSVEGDIRSWLESLNVEVSTPSGPSSTPKARTRAPESDVPEPESEETPTEAITPDAGVDWAHALAATIEDAVTAAVGTEDARTEDARTEDVRTEDVRTGPDESELESSRDTVTAVGLEAEEPDVAREEEPTLEYTSEPAPVFEIDLGREALYLSHPSDARDYIVSQPSLSFAPGWTSVAGLDEAKSRAPQPVSPIEWLRRAGGSGTSLPGTAAPAPSRSTTDPACEPAAGDSSPGPRHAVPTGPEIGSTPLGTSAFTSHGNAATSGSPSFVDPSPVAMKPEESEASRLPLEERLAAKAAKLGGAPRRAEPGAEVGASSIEIDSTHEPGESDREREARHGLQRVVEAIGRVEAEKDEWRERARQLERRLESERALRERAERERDERDETPQSRRVASGEGSIPMHDLGELDAASELLVRFGAGVRQFHVHGQLDRAAWLRLVADVAALGPALSQQWTGTLDAIPDPTDALGCLAVFRSRSFALSVSTLVREGCTGRSLRWATRNLAVAALLESTPGRDWRLETGADRTGREVGALLAEGQFLFPDEGGEVVGRPAGEMDVWQAASKLAVSSERLTTGWPAAIHAVLRETRPGRPARRGLTRVVNAHSIYLPGSWVELTSGEIGLVIAPSDGFPEMPRILVQFGRLGDRSIPIAPRWFPAPDGEVATVARVLEGPRICEETEWSSGGDPRR